MAVITTLSDSHRWRFRPPASVPLDRRSSLSRGLLAAFMPPRGANFTDRLGNAWTETGGPISIVAGQQGEAAAFNGTTQYYSNSSIILPTTQTTLLVVVSAPTSGATGTLFSPTTVVDSQRLTVTLPYAGVIYWDFGGQTPGASRISWTPPGGFFGAGVFHRMAFRAGPLGMSIWSDGVKVASQATVPPTRETTTSPVWLGASSLAGTSYFSNNVVEALFPYSRELRDSEILRWTANPYSMFAAPSSSSVQFALPAATSFVLGPATGLAGRSATVTATGTGTAWTSGTTFSVTGGTGASISGLSINVATQVAAFTLTYGTTAGTLTIADSTDSATKTVAVTLPVTILADSHRWRYKPPQSIGLDRRSSLSRGLIGAVLPRTLGNSPDVLGNVWANVGALTASAGQQGYAVAGNGSTSYLSCSSLQLPIPPITILCIAYPVNSGYNVAFSPGGNQVGGTYMRGILNGNLTFSVGSASYSAAAPASNYYNLWHRYAFRAGPSNVKIFLDGLTFYNTTGVISASTPTLGVRIGAETLSSTNYFGANATEALFIYNRELRDAEILAWTANPYSMFRAPADRVNPYTIPVSAGGGLIWQRESRVRRRSPIYL